MSNPIVNYFSDFKILKTASKEFWLINGLVFFDGLAYFSMMIVLTLFLTNNCGFSDVSAGKWVGYYGLAISVIIFAVGAVCDTIGVKKSFLFGIALLVFARATIGFAPLIFDGKALSGTIIGMMIVMAIGTSFMGPVMNTALRRFTTKENRSVGFSVYYTIMNIGAFLAGAVVTEGCRRGFGELNGNLAIMIFGMGMNIASFVCMACINEHKYADESERLHPDTEIKRPLAIFMEVWKESAFRKLVLLLVLTIGVRLVFTHQFMVMPKYYTRVLTSDFSLGLVNSINPLIIAIGLLLLIPFLRRIDTFKLVLYGMAISASSLIFMAVPIQWILGIPGIHNLDQAYLFVILAQILVFTLGEILFSPRFTEYISMMAPKDKVASYMSLSALPTFISKPINGLVSGLFIASFSYDGIRAKIDSGNVSYFHSPEFMWMIYLAAAVISPIAVLFMRDFLNKKQEATPPPLPIVAPPSPETTAEQA